MANTSHEQLGTLYLRTNKLYVIISIRESAMMHRNFRVQKLLFILEQEFCYWLKCKQFEDDKTIG